MKNNEEQPDQRRMAENLGSKLSFSASEPRTFRCMICILRNAVSIGLSKPFFRRAERMLDTSPDANKLATRFVADNFSMSSFCWTEKAAERMVA